MRLALVLLLALSASVEAAKTVTLQISGTDAYCTSYTQTTVGGVTTLTCVPAGGGTPGPTDCVATVNGGPTLALSNTGGTASLAVSCGSGNNLTYNWARNSTYGASTASNWSDNSGTNSALGPNATSLTRTTTYTARVCSGATCVTASPILSVTVAGTAAWAGTCSGYTKTLVMDISWASPTAMYTSDLGGFDANDALVIRFTTGTIPSTNNLPSLVGVEYVAAPFTRTAYLASTPCTFANNFPVPGAGPLVGSTITSQFAIAPGFGFGYYPVLQPSTTYYLNVKNNAGSGCVTGCDMRFILQKGSL